MSKFHRMAWPVAIPAAAALSLFGVVAGSSVASAADAPSVATTEAERPDPATIPYIGLHVKLTRDGAYVRGTVDGGPADVAGVEQGDKILSINGTRIDRPGTFRLAMSDVEPGDTIEAILERDGEQLTVRIVTGSQEDRPGLEEIPWFGAYPARPDRDPDTGLIVGKVNEGSPAATGGLKVGDEVVSVNGVAVDDVRGALGQLRDLDPGAVLTIVVDRDGSEVTLTVTLGAQADNPNREQEREERRERREQRRDDRQERREQRDGDAGEQGPPRGGPGGFSA